MGRQLSVSGAWILGRRVRLNFPVQRLWPCCGEYLASSLNISVFEAPLAIETTSLLSFTGWRSIHPFERPLPMILTGSSSHLAKRRTPLSMPCLSPSNHHSQKPHGKHIAKIVVKRLHASATLLERMLFCTSRFFVSTETSSSRENSPSLLLRPCR